MIVAGAVLSLRLSPLCSACSLYCSALLWLGALTAVYAALLSALQLDLKKIIAFSTCSHVALVLCAAGSMLPALGVYHLIAHAFSKAALFMLSGALIHLCSDEQDVRMLRLKAALSQPVLSVLLPLCALSLSGLPGLACSSTKDALISGSWLSGASYEACSAHNSSLSALILLSVLLSSLYSSVLIIGLL